MTTQTRTGRPVNDRAAGYYINRDHTVIGTATQLANIVANHRTAGTFAGMSAPRRVGDRYQVIIRLREYQRQPAQPTVQVTARRTRRDHSTAVTIATGTTSVLIATAAYLLGQLVELTTQGAANVVAPVTVLVLTAIAAIAIRRRARRRRRHCPGC